MPLFVWLIGVVSKWLQQRLKDGKTARELVHFQYDYKDVKQERAFHSRAVAKPLANI